MTSITQPLLLAPDVEIVPIESLSPEIQERLGQTDDHSHALSKRKGRSHSRVVDDLSRRLIDSFRQPRLLVDAVLELSHRDGLSPQTALDNSIPLIVELLRDGVLIGADSLDDEKTQSPALLGTSSNGATLDTLIYDMEDTQVYAGSLAGRRVAIKISTSKDRRVTNLFEREAQTLLHLNGCGAPKLLGQQKCDGRPTLVTAWVDGEPLGAAMRKLTAHAPRQALELSVAVIESYAGLHSRSVLHGDVHSGNILVDASTVTLIDFGQSSVAPQVGYGGGVPSYNEPELCSAILRDDRPAIRTEASEQYGVATLLLELLNNEHPIDLPLEAEACAQAILDHDPDGVSSRWLSADVLAVFANARASDPRRRYASMSDLANALRSTVGSCTRPVEQATTDTILTGLGLIPDAHRAQVVAATQSGAPTASLFYGAAGVAYALSILADLEKRSDLLDTASAWAMIALYDDGPSAYESEAFGIAEANVHTSSLYHGASGPLVVSSIIAAQQGDLFALNDQVRQLCQARPSLPQLDQMMGSTSLLRALRHLGTMPGLDESNAVATASRTLEIAEDLQGLVMTLSPLLNRSGTSLGAAHGIAGAVTELLRCKSAGLPVDCSGTQTLLAELELLAYKDAKGAWWPPVIDPTRQFPVMGAWCNGSAGFISLWLAASEVYDDGRYLELAKAAAMACISEPSAMHNLCCGIAGKALSVLELFRVTQDQRWLKEADNLLRSGHAIRSANGPLLKELDSVPLSLYKGDLGLAVATAAVRNQTTIALIP